MHSNEATERIARRKELSEVGRKSNFDKRRVVENNINLEDFANILTPAREFFATSADAF